MCEDAFSTHLYTQTQTSIGCGRWHNAQQRDWLVMNVFCERKHSESGCGLAASAVLRVSLFVYKASSRASPGPLSPAVSLLPLRCHHLASNQLCTVAPFLLFFKLSSIQETWLQPAYFMKDQPPTVYPSIHPTRLPAIHPSIHDRFVCPSTRLQPTTTQLCTFHDNVKTYPCGQSSCYVSIHPPFILPRRCLLHCAGNECKRHRDTREPIDETFILLQKLNKIKKYKRQSFAWCEWYTSTPRSRNILKYIFI